MSLKNKIFKFVLSGLGFSLAASAISQVQPEYGVRIQLDYGPIYMDNSIQIIGQIYNKKDSLTVPVVNVKLLDENKKQIAISTTDSNGHFQIQLKTLRHRETQQVHGMIGNI